MNNAQMLAARMSEVERMGVRASTPAALTSLYYNRYRSELSGGNLKGGTEAEGIAEMQEASEIILAEFAVTSEAPGFGRARN